MTATVKLYELAEMRDVLDLWLLEHAGEVTPELEELLAQLDGDANEKIVRVALYIREQLAIADAIELEVRRLGVLLATRRTAAENLKAYLKRQMERLGKSKVEGTLAVVAIQKNSQPSVSHTLDPEGLYAFPESRPYILREELVRFSIDRPALLLAWKTNPASVPAAFAVRQDSHVRIR